MAGKAEERMVPMMTERMPVQRRLAKGSIRVKGATPRTENQMMYFRPKRSPSGPPIRVPKATEMRKRRRWNWAFWMDMWNFSMR